jgi:hypothetical protein
MLLSEIIAPDNCQQLPPTNPQSHVPRLDPLDREIIKAVRDGGRYGISIWKVLNRVAITQNPTARTELRASRLQLWRKLQRLLKIGLVFRFRRKFVTLAKLPKLAVRRRRSSRAGSTVGQAGIPRGQKTSNQLTVNLSGQITVQQAAAIQSAKPKALDPACVTEKVLTFATPGPQTEAIASAGRALAKMSRARKHWSGWLGQERGYREQRIILPDGTVGFLYGALRGKVVVTLDRGRLLGGLGNGPFRWTVLPVDAVVVYREPAARLLGRLKRGVRERPSALKALAARRNCTMPPRPGSRPRGRPRKAFVTSVGGQGGQGKLFGSSPTQSGIACGDSLA